MDELFNGGIYQISCPLVQVLSILCVLGYLYTWKKNSLVITQLYVGYGKVQWFAFNCKNIAKLMLKLYLPYSEEVSRHLLLFLLLSSIKYSLVRRKSEYTADIRSFCGRSRNNSKSKLKKEVIGIGKYGEVRILAEFVGAEWSLIDSSPWSLDLQKRPDKDGDLFALTGLRKVRYLLSRWFIFSPYYIR